MEAIGILCGSMTGSCEHLRTQRIMQDLAYINDNQRRTAKEIITSSDRLWERELSSIVIKQCCMIKDKHMTCYNDGYDAMSLRKKSASIKYISQHTMWFAKHKHVTLVDICLLARRSARAPTTASSFSRQYSRRYSGCGSRLRSLQRFQQHHYRYQCMERVSFTTLQDIRSCF
jgi:hypothetical protein